MPELPEVETMRRGIQGAQGGIIMAAERVACSRRPIAVQPSLGTLRRRCEGQRIAVVGRRGKRVVLKLENGCHLVFEPRMTGLLLVSAPPTQEHLRFRLSIAKAGVSQILFWDRRGLGAIACWKDDEFQQRLGPTRLGPDALELTANQLEQRLSSTRRPIKVALLDQKLLAGVGNLYASEILHVAQIDPRRSANSLAAAEWRRLHSALRRVLNKAIKYEGSTLSDGTYRNALNDPGGYQNHHRVYDRAEQPCPTCTHSVRRIVQAQRSTFFCEHCQT